MEDMMHESYGESSLLDNSHGHGTAASFMMEGDKAVVHDGPVGWNTFDDDFDDEDAL